MKHITRRWSRLVTAYVFFLNMGSPPVAIRSTCSLSTDMNESGYPFTHAVLADSSRVISDPSVVRGLAGLDVDLGEQRLAEYASLPFDHKIKILVSELQAHIRIVADQAEELGDVDYTKQAYGEIVAILICLREIKTLFADITEH